jgi:hypothetical protein
VDQDGYVFMYRAFRPTWLPSRASELSQAIQALLGEMLLDPSLEQSCKAGLRGPHLAFIIGHARQYQKVCFCAPV